MPLRASAAGTQRHPAPTFVFADLAGYTALTDQHGDEAAAKVAREFRPTMCALSREHGAWQVKSMGDGVMIWASDAGHAIALAAHAVEHVVSRGDLLPVRVGVHTGPAVMRRCDWYGSAVNVAARLPSEGGAERGARERGDARSRAGPDAPALAGRRELVLRGVARPVSAWSLA